MRTSSPIWRPSSSGRPAESAFQNGIFPGCPGRRGDDDAIVGDLLDAPRRGAEQEGLSDAALEHHFFVELADARAGPALADEEDAVQAAIRNGSPVDDGDTLRAVARRDLVLQPVPREPRPQISEVVRRVAARQHVEHAVENRSAQIGERRGRPYGPEQGVHVPRLHRHHGDHLLREDVERIARVARGFDPRLVHRPCHGGARDQVAAILRHDDAPARLIDRVAGASDALHAACDRRWRFNLDDEIDRPHVDPELEGGRSDQSTDLPGLQAIFDLHPLRPGERSVVCPHEWFAGQLVEGAGDPLGDAPAVDENERGTIGQHQFQQPWIDRGPDGRAVAAGRGTAGDVVGLAHPGHVLDRHFDGQLEPLLLRRIHDGDVAESAVAVPGCGRRELLVDRLLRRQSNLAAPSPAFRAFDALSADCRLPSSPVFAVR